MLSAFTRTRRLPALKFSLRRPPERLASVAALFCKTGAFASCVSLSPLSMPTGHRLLPLAEAGLQHNLAVQSLFSHSLCQRSPALQSLFSHNLSLHLSLSPPVSPWPQLQPNHRQRAAESWAFCALTPASTASAITRQLASARQG